MKKFISEFKEFISKGNVLDMAVGVIIGGAFSKIVSSLVNDVMMPLIGIIIGGHDFTNLSIKVGNAKIMYGSFLQNVVDFLIVAFCLFTVIKIINRFKKKQEKNENKEKIKTPSEEVILLSEIRDLLKEQNQKLEFQLKDLKKEELLLTVKKNNEEELKNLKEQNDKIEKQLSLNIKKEEETKEESSDIKEETSEIKEPETKNNDFKLVEIEEVEVIKNPYHNSNEKPKEDNVKTNIITKTEPAPSWLEYAIVENEHKFINWFDKLNALIKRKKYLKDE